MANSHKLNDAGRVVAQVSRIKPNLPRFMEVPSTSLFLWHLVSHWYLPAGCQLEGLVRVQWILPEHQAGVDLLGLLFVI